MRAFSEGIYSDSGVTPLMMAFENTFSVTALAVVKLLLRSGADLEASDHQGMTAYNYAQNLLPDEIYADEELNWFGNVVNDALNFFDDLRERRRIFQGRVKLLLLRKLVENRTRVRRPRRVPRSQEAACGVAQGI